MTITNSADMEFSTSWDKFLNRICSNVRQLDILLSDFSIAFSMIGYEVDKNDLLNITAIQRFNPELYKAVYENQDFVTYAQSWIKNPQYVPDEKRKLQNETALVALKSAIDKSDEPEAYRAMLETMFPVLKYKLDENLSKRKVEWDYRDDIQAAKNGRKISHPDYFPIYFRYQVPDSIVGSREFSSIIRRIEESTSEARVFDVIRDILDQIPRGSLKRYDLLDKLSDQKINLKTSTWICYSLARLSNNFQYDMMDIGEASLALDFVFGAAKEATHDARLQLFVNTLLLSIDDTFAVRILQRSSPRTENRPAEIDLTSDELETITKAFRKRMVRHYGQPSFSMHEIIETCDPQAFWRWTSLYPHDTAIAHKFWRRYISQDKGRLAWVSNIFFLRFGWSENPQPMVNKIFSDKFLRHALQSFRISAESKPDYYDDAIRWITDYLDGKFKNGISPFWRRGMN